MLFCNCINDGDLPSLHALKEEYANRPKYFFQKEGIERWGLKGAVRRQASVVELM